MARPDESEALRMMRSDGNVRKIAGCPPSLPFTL